MKTLFPLIFSVFLASSLIAQVTIDPPSRSFTKDGGAGAILTQGSGSWTASTADSWITITPRTSGTVGESCIYVISSNFSADTRIGEIDINGNTHTVSQSGYPATLSPTSTTVDLDGGGGSVSVSVAAGVSWTATSDTEWIDFTPASGTSSGPVSYTVDPNPGVTIRNGSLTIAGQTFTITQTGTDVNLSPKSVEKAYSSDIIQLQVTALVGTSWSVTPSTPWISVVDDGNGFGDSQITLAVGTNPSFLERTGTVSIGSATFTIVQAGTPYPALDIIPDEATADPIGAFGNAAILATPDSPWTAESEEPWIIISEGASGAGNGNIGYVVSANPDLTERTGRIRVTPPFNPPAVDLSKQLLCYIPSGDQDLSGWYRALSGSLSVRFDGTTPINLIGQDFYRSSDAFTFALTFNLGDIDTINRIMHVDRAAGSYSTLYVDASNRLVFSSAGETLVTDLVAAPNVNYQVVIAAEQSGATAIYAGRRDSTITEVGSMTFAEAPFPANYVTPARITLGQSPLPVSGSLTNADLRYLRLYGRALSAREAGALFEREGTSLPYGEFSQRGDAQNVVVEYNFQGQALVAGGTNPPASFTSGYDDSFHSTITSFSTSESVVSTYSIQPSRFVQGIQSSADGGLYTDYILYWRYQFVYEDGSTAYTNLNSKYTLGAGWNSNANPYPSKRVSQIKALARITRSSDRYALHWSKVQYHSETQLAIGWESGSDRYNIAGRALESTSDSRVVLRNHQSSFSAPSATYNFWLRFDTPAQAAVIFKRNSYGGTDLACGLDASSNLYLGANSFPVDLVAGEWVMLSIASTYGGSCKVYIDGQEIGNTSTLASYRFGSDSNFQEMIIGGWDGAIDYAGFYNGALSSPEIAALYDSQSFDYQYHTVTQGTLSPAVSPAASSFAASGGSGSAELTIAGNVNWSASTNDPWISLTSESSGIGSTTATYDVAANSTVYERQGSLTLAGETVQIIQAGLGATLDYVEFIFGTDGGSDWIDVSPEANGSWQAVSNDSWLTIALGESGTGPGSVLVVADPYSQTSQSRTGTVTVAGETIYITQRGYQLSVSPQIAQVGSNSGAGEFGVAAPISAVWEAITTQPWITIIGGTTGVGNGTLRYSVAENTTGAARTGRIVVSGAEYTITQVSSLQVSATAELGGSVSGAGAYETNATAVLTANPDTGYVFSHWTGDAVGSTNALNLSVDSDKDVVAHFIPSSAATSFETAGQNAVLSNPNAYDLYEESQLRTMAVGNPFMTVDTATNKLTVGFGLQQTENLSNWSPVNVQASQTFIRDGNIEVELTVDADAKFYRIITE